MVQKSANRFVLGTRRTGTRSPERRQYGLSIDAQGTPETMTHHSARTHGKKKRKRNARIFRVSLLKQARLIRSEKRKKCETSLKLFSTKEAYSVILDKSFLAPTAEGRILNHGFTKEEIPNIYKVPFKILKEQKLIMFQVKIIHNILTTQSSLFHARITDTDVCPLCNLESQSLKHMLITCSSVARKI